MVAQYVYGTESFDSPFLLTYIGTSLFTLWLPVKFSSQLIFETNVPRRDIQDENNVLLDDNSYRSAEDRNRESGMTAAPNQADESEHTSATQRLDQPQQMPQEQAHRRTQWTDDDHIRVAMRIAPVWFVANWSYNASLLYTSITSSTVLASTSSLFTFLFAVWVKDESFAWIRLVGVLLGVSGGVLTALHDATDRRALLQNEKNADASDTLALFGDFLGLLSAIGYGAYAVQTRVYCPKDESLYSMQLLLGYIGLLNMVVLSPIAIYLLLSTGDVLEWFILGCVVLKGLFDNFLRYGNGIVPRSVLWWLVGSMLLIFHHVLSTRSDYLWLRAVLLTNATVATVGLALTIPLAFGSDVIMGKPNVLTLSSIFGAVSVLVGFVLVNVGSDDDTASTIDNGPMELPMRTSSEEIEPDTANDVTTRVFE